VAQFAVISYQLQISTAPPQQQGAPPVELAFDSESGIFN
jgi:hypothetical protein